MRERQRLAKTPVTIARIAETAIALADAEGMPALSMRKIGSKLGIQAMSLYHHVPSKVVLLDEMAARLTRSLPRLDVERGWSACLTTAAIAWRDLATRHPGAFALVATRAQTRPALLDWYAGLLQVLTKAGAQPHEGARLAASFMAALNGFLLDAEAPPRFAEHTASSSGQSLLRPNTLAALEAVPAAAWDLKSDDAFVAHVAFLLDAVAATLARSTRAPA